MVCTNRGSNKKKLIEAGEYWGRPKRHTQDDYDDIQALGLGDAIKPDPPFEVFYENWQAIEIFSRCETQWRYPAMGGPTGLDYSAVLAVFDLLGIKKRKRAELFDKVRLIERGALNAISSK